MDKSTIQKVSAASLLVALGIIYGDIGTSPLYVMKSIISDRAITELLVYGGISCVFWTLTFQTTFKYVFLTLSADNHGEGGVFSLYALVKRFGKGKLVIPTILGATTLLADGIITPPISVASAVEGLEAVVPNLPTIPIVLAKLIAPFNLSTLPLFESSFTGIGCVILIIILVVIFKKIRSKEWLPVLGFGWFLLFIIPPMFFKLYYSKYARYYGIEGWVTLQFTIAETGEISQIKVLRGVGAGLNDIARDVLFDLSENWNPFIEDGVPKKIRYTLPT